jgi:hypothetical protein
MQIFIFNSGDRPSGWCPVFEPKIEQSEEALMEEVVSGLLNVAVKPHADFDTLQKIAGLGRSRGQGGG